MELIRGLYNLRPRHAGTVATVGNFDGVHLGHQAILARLGELGRFHRLPTTVVSFEPLPHEALFPDRALPRLSSLREKCAYLSRYGVDRFLVLRFDHRLAALEAGAFLESVLVRGLSVQHLLIGDDFRFGRNRRGDFALLQEAAVHHGYIVESSPTVRLDGERVSSTRIRQLLAAGDIETATALLGHGLTLRARVGHGDRMGRKLGFPTANLSLGPRLLPVSGVFAAWIDGIPPSPLPSVVNIGTRPTLAGVQRRVEAHILDFDGDLYGRHLSCTLLKRLRSEQRFPSLDALKTQIGRDVASARAFFRTR